MSALAAAIRQPITFQRVFPAFQKLFEKSIAEFTNA
jgi:hypothetical protein